MEGVSTKDSEICSKCEVIRAPLPDGGWCSTCGYNPKYEAKCKELEERISDMHYEMLAMGERDE